MNKCTYTCTRCVKVCISMQVCRDQRAFFDYLILSFRSVSLEVVGSGIKVGGQIKNCLTYITIIAYIFRSCQISDQWHQIIGWQLKHTVKFKRKVTIEALLASLFLFILSFQWKKQLKIVQIKAWQFWTGDLLRRKHTLDTLCHDHLCVIKNQPKFWQKQTFLSSQRQRRKGCCLFVNKSIFSALEIVFTVAGLNYSKIYENGVIAHLNTCG